MPVEKETPMPLRKLMLAALAFFVAAGYALAADITGKWTASFDSQVGQQNYTYEFQVKGSEITGTAKSANGESKITDGKLEGDTVKFVENLDFQGMPLRIEYKGKVVSADEIKFTRKVADVATEELVAKRAK
jgi:hypothetical protein